MVLKWKLVEKGVRRVMLFAYFLTAFYTSLVYIFSYEAFWIYSHLDFYRHECMKIK